MEDEVAKGTIVYIINSLVIRKNVASSFRVHEVHTVPEFETSFNMNYMGEKFCAS
jgi:hypothetical protein